MRRKERMKVKTKTKYLAMSFLVVFALMMPSTPIYAQENGYKENPILVEAPDYYSEENQQLREDMASTFAVVLPDIDPNVTKTLNIVGYKQSNNYYCGPASVKTVLQYLNGNSLTQAQYASNMGTTSSYGTYVYKIVNELNRVEGSGTYMYSQVSDLDLSEGTKYSIDNNYPLIYHALTTKLPGYSGSSGSGHYIVGYKYNYYLNDSNVMQYNISYWDPYDNGGTSYGAHTVTESTLTTAINARAGYYILKAQ